MNDTKRSSETLFPLAMLNQFAREAFALGWNNALDAAREAVRDSAICFECGHEDALDAIDALKEKP